MEEKKEMSQDQKDELIKKELEEAEILEKTPEFESVEL